MSTRGSVCVCVSRVKQEEKKAMTTKPKNNRLCEVIILTFIVLLILHPGGQKFTGYKFRNTKKICFPPPRNIKILLDCDLTFLKWKAFLPHPLSDSVYA